MNKQLLSISADAKTVKGQKLGYLTGILYLAPSNISGFQVCPMAKIANCERACLYSAGRGAFTNVQKARIAKTVRFHEERAAFMLDLIYSVEQLIKKANKLGLTPLIRLNGTSDIRWESIAVINRDGLTYASIMDIFNSVQFYDYTKIANRKNIPTNYDLTFSYSGVAGYQPYVTKAKANAALSRIAVVFDKVENIPASFIGMNVFPGDNSDVRHLDAKNSVIALYAKGNAKEDTTGFVVRV
jgi:hypothetical protein